jgi:hypothetical protein
MKFNAFLNLLLDALLWSAIRRIEGLIAAKGTTTCADSPIPIGAAEARVDADFLYTPAELLREVVAVAVETPVVAPWE